MDRLLTVHDPRGYPPKVTGKRLAPRLESLDGKIVYLVDCLFDNSEAFMNQLRQWFAAASAGGRHADHQAARELGRRRRRCAPRSPPRAMRRSSASAYEAPVARRSSGWRWHWRRPASQASPCTRMCSRAWRARRRSQTACRGRARPSCRSRWSAVRRRELRAYIEGTDPVSRRPFMQEVIEALTAPLDEEDLKGVSFERSTPRLLAPDTEENLQRLFIDNHWTDFLPIVLPTEERVAAMLKGTSHPPDKVVGRMRPTSFREFWEFTVEKVAVNAVMAGARPEYFPVILALAASGVTRAIEQHHLVGDDRRGQRPDPARDRHELPGSARWAPTITPMSRSAAPTTCCRRISRADRCRARPTWARSATGSPTAAASPRTRKAARGSRCTCRRASSRPTAR